MCVQVYARVCVNVCVYLGGSGVVVVRKPVSASQARVHAAAVVRGRPGVEVGGPRVRAAPGGGWRKREGVCVSAGK